MEFPPQDFTICPSCGTEFGYHDASRTFLELRNSWIVNGMRWHSRAIPSPLNWSAVAQLLSAGMLAVVSKPVSETSRNETRLDITGLNIQFAWAV
jgi:hypothetical protein